MSKRKVTAKELERVINDPETQRRVSATFQELLKDLDKGLPRAASGKLLNSRMQW